jgi:hypothetical protein
MAIPEEFLCPITTALMTDPVLGSDGHSYERSAITEWLTHHQTSPITRETMTIANLKPNYALKAMIERSVRPIPRQYWRTNTSNPKSPVISVASAASSVVTEPYYALAATHPQQSLANAIIPMRPPNNNEPGPRKLAAAACILLAIIIFIIVAIRTF